MPPKAGGGGDRKADNSTNANRLSDDAVVDEKGRQLCYAHVHGKCTLGDKCPRAHCPETKAMKVKRLKDELEMSKRNERALVAKLEKQPPTDTPEKVKKAGKKKKGGDGAGDANKAGG